jgi:hypothetical protein
MLESNGYGITPARILLTMCSRRCFWIWWPCNNPATSDLMVIVIVMVMEVVMVMNLVAL